MVVMANRTSLGTSLLLAIFFLGSCSANPEKAKTRYFQAGQSYMKKGNYGDAAVQFRNALRMDPRFVDAYYQLSKADLAKNDWTAAYAAL